MNLYSRSIAGRQFRCGLAGGGTVTGQDKAAKRTALIVLLLITAAVACRFLGNAGFYSDRAGLVRAALYIGLFAAWGISIKDRIIQTQARRYLTAIAALMVFWFLLRTARYDFVSLVSAPNLSRYLWYLFYLPMLFIPLLAVFVAMSLGKPENSHLPGRAALLYIPTVILLALVLTNDLHQLVFTFPADAAAWTPSDNGYAVGYYLVVAWLLACGLLMLAALWKKSRLPYSRKRFWMPLVPIGVLLIYMACYYSGWAWLRFIAGDMTAVICLMYAATLEICIRCGLIQSNTHYTELFHASTIGAQITDRELSVVCAAENAGTIDRQTMAAAVRAPVVTADGVRVSEAPLRSGHVFWQEDISPLLAVLQELDGTREELRSYGSLLQEENRQKARRRKLEEQKRLYGAVREKLAPQAARLSALAKELEAAPDTDTARHLLWKMAVIGAYFKRRSNLIFLAGRDGLVPAGELRLCMDESVSNLRLRVKNCACLMDFEGSLCLDTAAALYDFFEAAVEASLDTLSGLSASFSREDGSYLALLMLQGAGNLTDLAEDFPGACVLCEDGVWHLMMTVPEGGGPL